MMIGFMTVPPLSHQQIKDAVALCELFAWLEKEVFCFQYSQKPVRLYHYVTVVSYQICVFLVHRYQRAQ